VQNFALSWSHPLSYHLIMAQRQKRSISLPAELAHVIELADGLARAQATLRRQPSRQSA